MGVLPLEFKSGENRETLGLNGHEVSEIEGVASLSPKKAITVRTKSNDGSTKTFTAIARVDTPEEVSYYHHGGILQYVLRQMLCPTITCLRLTALLAPPFAFLRNNQTPRRRQ